MTEAPSEYERVKIFSLVKDEDGSISRVPKCLCELCRVNHFLCPRYIGSSAANPDVMLKELYQRAVKESLEKTWIDFEGVRYIHFAYLKILVAELRSQQER